MGADRDDRGHSESTGDALAEVQELMGAAWSYFVVNALYLAIVVIVLSHAYSLPGQGGLVPLVIGVPTVLMALGAMLRRARLRRAQPQPTVAAAREDDVAPWRRAGPIVAWLVALLVMVFFLGFYVSIPLFAFTYLKSSGRVGWLGAITLAVVLWGTVYLGFAVILERPLFEGTLFGAILPLL